MSEGGITGKLQSWLPLVSFNPCLVTIFQFIPKFFFYHFDNQTHRIFLSKLSSFYENHVSTLSEFQKYILSFTCGHYLIAMSSTIRFQLVAFPTVQDNASQINTPYHHFTGGDKSSLH